MSMMSLLSSNNLSILSRAVFASERNDRVTRCSISKRPVRNACFFKESVLPQPTFARLFPQYRRDCALLCKPALHIVRATGTEVVVEEPNSPVMGEDSGEQPKVEANGMEITESSSPKPDATSTTVRSKRSRPTRKSEMPEVKNEELITGATFTGKVRSIQPFGAFIDFGAFTDGLVHVSRLSDSYVKDVANVVSIGQEVKVRLVEVNLESGRISLSMRENDGPNRSQQKKDAPPASSSDRPKPVRKDQPKAPQRRVEAKSSKFVVGQELQGTVKNIVRAGSFISLPDGEEGFLPLAEESGDGFSQMMGQSSLEAGQEVTVRVLRLARGQATLTMKTEDDDNGKAWMERTEGVVHKPTNPFVLAFRQNKEIATFLDEREAGKKATPIPDESQISNQSEILDFTPNSVDEALNANETLSTAGDDIQVTASIENEVEQGAADENGSASILETQPDVIATLPVEGTMSTTGDEIKVSASIENEIEQFAADEIGRATVLETQPEVLATLSVEDGAGTTSTMGDEIQASASIENEIEQVVADEIGHATVLETQPEVQATLPVEDEPGITSIESQVDEVVEELPVSTNEVVEVQSLIESETSSSSTAPAFEEIESSTEQVESATGEAKASISPALVKQLREESGAGMMDCKKALAEANGDMVKAQELLRTKGLAGAEKKASRATAEGRIGSYIHDSRIGILIEVNCETDFVSRGDIFKELVDDLAMQVAACPQVEVLVPEDVSEEIVSKEKDIEMQKEDLLSKPEQIRSKIVEGRIKKRLDEISLMEQPYIKNDKVAVKDLVKQTIMSVGENIKVKRFIRFNLGEGLEKKSQDFAAEVAAQTAAKKETAPAAEQPNIPEDKEVPPQASSVAVSAALVKQLREETGAGMMDCKKALSETGGDLEKAQEYLRKKGLSAADKKSSRLAAEGRIGTYIHDSRIGVLIEVNCETDFVGRSENFKQLVDDLAMQVVACPQVQFVTMEEIPESFINEEKNVQRQREDLQSKPENMRERIIEGRVSKVIGELALLEQPFIKNDAILVKDLVKQTITALGENIKIRRFVRFTLGESSE